MGDGEIIGESVTLLGPGLMLGVVPVGVSLSGVVGGTRPWMVLETRAETVTRLRSEEEGRFCGLVEVLKLSEETTELVEVRCGFVPFSDTPVGVFMEVLGDSTVFTVSPAGDVVAKGEEGLGVSVSKAFEAPHSTGGRGARYLTLAGCG